MLPSSVLRPKRQMCFNKSRQYEEKSFHFSLRIPVTAHLFHFPCLLCAVSRREKTLSNWAPRTRRGLGNGNNSTLLASCRRRLARTARLRVLWGDPQRAHSAPRSPAQLPSPSTALALAQRCAEWATSILSR